MSKILPINKNPLLRAYPVYGFVESVINNEYTTGSRLATITVINYQNFNWNIQNENSFINIENNIINIFIEPYSNYSRTCIYRKCNEIDNITIRIDHQLPNSPWEYISIFIKPIIENIIVDESSFSYVMGKFRKYEFFADSPFEQIHFFGQKYIINDPHWMRINKINDKIEFYVSSDQIVWDFLIEYPFEKHQFDGYCIGLNIPYNGNDYFNWFFSNFIQLCGGTMNNFSLPVIYNSYSYKSNNLFAANPFVTTLAERKYIYNIYGLSLWEYIVKNINIGRYLQISIDEYFIPGTNAYRNKYHYTHANLIYGYDKNLDKLHIINYFDGKPVCMMVTYQDLKVAFEHCDYEFIFLYEYYMDFATYKLNVERICEMLHCYLEGKGYHDIGLGVMAAPLNVVYGIKLYDDYIKSQYPAAHRGGGLRKQALID